MFLAFIIFLLLVCSIISLIVGLIKPSAFIKIFKKDLGRKKTGLIFTGVTVVLFIFFCVVVVNTSTPTTAPSKGNNGKVITKATEKPSTKIKSKTIPGLNVSRDTIMNRLQNADPTLNFQPSSDVNGITRYMAEKGQNDIELYGNADNLVEVDSTALLGNDSDDMSSNTTALIYVLGVGSAVDSKSAGWIGSAMKTISTDWSNNQTSVNQSTVIDGLKYNITAMQSSELDYISLSIYSAQESQPPTQPILAPQSSQGLTIISANNVLTTSVGSPYHASAPYISGYPGDTKVQIKASIVTTASGMTFTNDEKDLWDDCAVLINPASGAENWYEYDFSSMSSGQSTTIQWSQVTRDDGTAFDPTTAIHGSSIIELTCDLSDTTIGFADFKY